MDSASNFSVNPELLQQANRIAAETCYNLAMTNLQRGNNELAYQFFQRAAKLRGEGETEKDKEEDIGNSETQFHENGSDMSTRSFCNSSRNAEDATKCASLFEDPCKQSDASSRSHGSRPQRKEDVSKTATQLDRNERESNTSSKSSSSSERSKHAGQFNNVEYGRNVPSGSSGSSSERTKNANRSAGQFNDIEHGRNAPPGSSGSSSERTRNANTSAGQFNKVGNGRNVPSRSSGGSSERTRSRSEHTGGQFNRPENPEQASFRTSCSSSAASDTRRQRGQFDKGRSNGKSEHLDDEKKTKTSSSAKERTREGRFSSENKPMRKRSTKRPSNSDSRDSGLKNNESKANLSQRMSQKKANFNRNGYTRSTKKETKNTTPNPASEEDNVETIGDCGEPLGITLSPYYEAGKYWVKYCVKKILEIVLLAVAVIALVLITVGSVLWILCKFLLAVIIRLLAYFWSRSCDKGSHVVAAFRNVFQAFTVFVGCVLSDLLGITYFASWATRKDARKERNSYSPKMELPKTAVEAVNHLIHCDSNNSSPFETLLVDKDASTDEIRRNYRKMALLVHPDKLAGLNEDAERATKILNAAYDILGDETKREQLREGDVMRDFENKFKSEFGEFISKLQNSIPCNICGGRHEIVETKRKLTEGRYCSHHKDYHLANEGDVWVEKTFLGMRYLYLCTVRDFELKVYHLKNWGTCQSLQFGEIPPNFCRVVLKMKSGDQNQESNKFPGSNKSRKRKKYRK